MRIGAWLLVLTSLLAPATTAAGQLEAEIGAAPARERLALGQTLAKRDCGGCHAVGPAGDSPLSAAPRFRDLHRRYPVEQLGEALAEGIVVGHGPMPEWVLSPQEIEALTAYLKSLEPDAAKAPRP
ncbi:c-type cytochrome [Caulobacter sp.]|uniref:c-type cytochrome n=1 Tax=Caulobacter sp. TaxID=78 RepID=UPI003BB1D7FB